MSDSDGREEVELKLEFLRSYPLFIPKLFQSYVPYQQSSSLRQSAIAYGLDPYHSLRY